MEAVNAIQQFTWFLFGELIKPILIFAAVALIIVLVLLIIKLRNKK